VVTLIAITVPPRPRKAWKASGVRSHATTVKIKVESTNAIKKVDVLEDMTEIDVAKRLRHTEQQHQARPEPGTH
jgi:hypothetical protein